MRQKNNTYNKCKLLYGFLKMTCVLRLLCFVASVFVLAKCDIVDFKDCGRGNVKQVNVTGCPKSPCEFKLGTHVEIKATFIADMAAKYIFPEISVSLKRGEITFPEPRVDACALGKIVPRCPLKRNGTYTYSTDLEIRSYYPTVSKVTTVTYKGVNLAGEVVACVQINATIVKNPSLKKSRRN